MSALIVFHIISGDALYSGAILLLIAIAITATSRKRAFRAITAILALSGLALVILSATPTPLWLLIAWLLITIAWFVLEPLRSPAFRKFRFAARAAAAVTILALVALEIPHARTPRVPCPPTTRVCVIGDSISAGIDNSRNATWPALLAHDTGLDVVNLAQAGATTLTARQQAENIPPDAGLVILEIGGNDLLRYGDSQAFRTNLDQLLADVARPGRSLFMFELPLLPTFNAFGQAQRDLAAQYSVTLIPKRRFARILTSGGATLDGLHLSPPGHEKLATLIRQILGY